MTARAAHLLGVALLLGGCTVGPDYHPPANDQTPRHFSEPTAPAPILGKEWWTILGDPVLDQLIADALKSSPDLAIAQTRIVEARAELAIARAEELPEADAGATYKRQHGSANVPVGTPPGGLGPNVGSNLFLAGFDASWEIDLFGGRRRAIESADAALDAVTAEQRDVELSLVAEIARDYVELRTAQRRLDIVRELVDIRRDLLKLVSARFDSGLAGALDTARARTELEAGEAELADLRASEHAAIYRLGTLVGQAPEELLPSLSPPRPIPVASKDVPVGLPSDLLKRRPDIRAAERRIAAANARIGVAEADLYPHFALTGGAGFESLQQNKFLVGPSRYFSVGPSVDWLIFDAGRVRDEILAERARTDAAAARYRKIVLGALGEVETALVIHAQSLAAKDSRGRELASARQALDLARRLYEKGLEDYLAVLDAERTVHDSEMDLARTDQECTDSMVALIKALGGGWQDAEAERQP